MKARLLALWARLEITIGCAAAGGGIAIFWLSLMGVEDGWRAIAVCSAVGALAGAIWTLVKALRGAP